MTRKKLLETIVVFVVGIALLGGGFWLGWSSGREYPRNIVVTGVANMSGNGSSTAPDDFSVFWEAWQTINDLYLRNPSTTAQQKIQGAMNGLVNSLGDPYTEFFTPADNQQFQQNITGDFGGIGAELGVNDKNVIVIIAPLADTPAEKAGLKPKDEILAVNGSSTASMTVDDAVSVIRGPVGSVVTLTVFRDGWSAPKDFKITRATITVPNVEFAMKGDVAVITLSEFTQDADYAFYQALVKAMQNNAQGIVLDLRDDPGGYLQVAVDIAGYFVKPGALVVKEVGRSVPELDYKAQGDGALADFPLVVLMNEGSASAAEILAGALHDNRGTPLVGTVSFGKGTVQQLQDLSDGSSIKVTVAHWILPSGETIDHVGLTPDYAVSSTLSATSTTDAQLNKALEVIRQQIGK
jgi:carboxyl-terminal processing protease